MDELNEAFLSARNNVRLGQRLTPGRNFVSHFSIAVLSKYPEKATDIQKELLSLKPKKVEKEKNAPECFAAAEGSMKSNDYLQAVSFYQLSAKKYEDASFAIFLPRINACSERLVVAAGNAVRDKRLPTPKSFRQQIYKWYADLRKKIQHVQGINETQRVIWEADCLHNTAAFHVANRKSYDAIIVCKEGIGLMDRKLPDTKRKYKVYGWYLNFMALMCFDTKRFKDVHIYTDQAIEAHQEAEDFKTEKDRQSALDKARNMSRNVNENRSRLDL